MSEMQKRINRAAQSHAQQRSAVARQCPACKRKSALGFTSVHGSYGSGDFTIVTECRWCHWFRESNRRGDKITGIRGQEPYEYTEAPR